MIKVYRKTATIKAEQFDGSDEMVDKYELIDAGTMLGTHHSPELYLTGSGKVDVGDWIATGVHGEHWLIADAVFNQTYAELDERVEEKKYYVKICDGYFGHLNIGTFTGKMSLGSASETEFAKTKFTDKDIEELKQRDDIPLDWDKVRFEEAN